MNLVILIGRLGQDPEQRSTNSGKTVCNFTLATNDQKDVTEWHRVVCFDKTAENVARYMKKGGQVSIEGRNQTRKWEDKDGRDRWTTEVVAYRVGFLGGGNGNGSGGGQREERTEQTPAGDDIPF